MASSAPVRQQKDVGDINRFGVWPIPPFGFGVFLCGKNPRVGGTPCKNPTPSRRSKGVALQR
eukprot:12850137-Prorocentrum_lima.AAC.1